MKRKADQLTIDFGNGRKYKKISKNVAGPTISTREMGTQTYKRKYYRRPKTPFGDVGGIIGKKLSNLMGFGDAGENTGRWLASGLGKALFGSGDYKGNLETIQTNSIVNPSQVTPTVISGLPRVDGDSVIVRRTEYVKDIVSSSVANTFAIETFAINPGQKQLFPFLHQIARNYEEYRIRGLVMHFKSLSGDSVASVQSGLGYVAMATQYDALDATFTNKNAIENYSMSQSGKPSVDQIHGIECQPQMNALTHLYVRTTTQPANTDLRLYDVGKFSIANACPGTSVTLGELWISYDIELFKPKVAEISQDVGAVFKQVRRSVSTTTADFGLIVLETKGSIIGNVTATTAEFENLDPNGQFVFIATWVQSGTFSSSVGTITVTTGSLIADYSYNSSGSLTTWNVSSGSNAAMQRVYAVQPDSSGTLLFTQSGGTIASANVTVHLQLIAMEKL